MSWRCIIHFEGKTSPLKTLTNPTLAKITQRRREWLDLPESDTPYKQFKSVAEASFTSVPDGTTQIEDLPQLLCYHTACYRTFTDITKIERARKREVNSSDCGNSYSGNSNDDAHDGEVPPNKVQRTTRQSFGANRSARGRESSNILPELCLICKHDGPIYAR